MPFIARLTKATLWLSTANAAGVRTLTDHDGAAVFQTAADARVAIAKLPEVYAHFELTFLVEPLGPAAF
jgi:hypothetical protein